ncbi:MAG: hypothetical protein CVT96_02540 [Bacteroidetes bacterium HGW-Bacteroidetes-13]|nr:MAG: hypothetical protein CVT96_02540 [Bacteroidetes bacterium HGW-Bacteroidetes-13]
MSTQQITGIHLLSFIILTVLLFFTSEFLLKTFASGIHTVEMWINLIVYGTIGILILNVTSCLIFLRKQSKS